MHWRYENGRPITTVTTISAASTSVSVIAQMSNGRILSRRVIEVMKQYMAATLVYNCQSTRC